MLKNEIIKRWRGGDLEIQVIVEVDAPCAIDRRKVINPNNAYFYQEKHTIMNAKNNDYYAEETREIGEMFLRISKNIKRNQ